MGDDEIRSSDSNRSGDTAQFRQGPRALNFFFAGAATFVGIALILAPLGARGVAAVTGAGLVIVGASALLQTRFRSTTRPAGRTPALDRGVAVALIVFGAIAALFPSAGAAWVPFLICAGLIAHGAFSLVRALRGASPTRAADLLSAIAGIIFGTLVFTWPVLTLGLFRVAAGAWLIFIGLQLLVEALLRQQSLPTSPNPHQPAPPHRWARTLGAATALLVAVLFAAGSSALLGGARLPEPDAFYKAPNEVPAEPGRLLRVESLTAEVPDGAEAWRILYTTSHPDGSPAISSGTVLAPASRGADPVPLLTVAHGTTGVVPKCAPSLSATPFADGAGAALTEMVTAHGWAAVTSDYIGLGTAGTHPYLIGDAEARNVLDASLAVQELSSLTTTTDTVVWGHSQGGQGALWTGQIAADYAPELTVLGIAAFAPAADLYGLAEADKNEAAGKTVSAYIASTWNSIYPELDLEQHLTPGAAGGVERIRDLCFNGRDVLGAILSGTQIPNQVFPDALLRGAFGEQLKAQEPTGPFPAPVLVAQGLADPLIKPAMQREWVTSRCTAGVEIDYRTYPGLDHNSLVAADSPLTPQLVQWTLDRWANTPATPNCDDLPGS